MAELSNPANPEGKFERFLELPPEVRLMILRELLVQDHAIQDQDRSRDAEDHGKSKIYPEILRTCQHLYRDGMLVLYGQNTLNIRCVFENSFGGLFVDDDDYKVHILGGYFNVPGSIAAAESKNSSLRAITESSDESGPMWIHQNGSVLQRFTKIELEIPFHEPEFVYICCQVLAPLLIGKHVVVRPSANLDEASVRDIQDTDHAQASATQAQTKALSACQTLRCLSFSVHNLQVPNAILSTITGSTPVPPIFERWISFKDRLRLSMSFTDDPWVFFDRHGDDADPVYQAMMNFDEVAFVSRVEVLGRVAREWSRAALESYSRIMEGVTQPLEL